MKRTILGSMINILLRVHLGGPERYEETILVEQTPKKPGVGECLKY